MNFFFAKSNYLSNLNSKSHYLSDLKISTYRTSIGPQSKFRAHSTNDYVKINHSSDVFSKIHDACIFRESLLISEPKANITIRAYVIADIISVYVKPPHNGNCSTCINVITHNYVCAINRLNPQYGLSFIYNYFCTL